MGITTATSWDGMAATLVGPLLIQGMRMHGSGNGATTRQDALIPSVTR
jgi:hypothetical protein